MLKFNTALFTTTPVSISSEDFGVATTVIPSTTLKSVPISPKLNVIDFISTILLLPIKELNFEICEVLSICIVLVE